MAMNFVTFNQDYSCLAVGKYHLRKSQPLLTPPFQGTSKGFRIYHTDPFAKIFSSNDGNVAIIEMLFSTSLVALILSPRHLVIQNTKVGIPYVRLWNSIFRKHILTAPDSDPRLFANLHSHLQSLL